MKQNMKRILACVLAGILVFQYLPAGVSAAGTERPVLDQTTDTDLTAGKNLSTNFGDSNKLVLFDLGVVTATKEAPTWYYQGTFKYTAEFNNYCGVGFIFGKGTYESETRNLALSIRPTGTAGDNQIVLWAGDTQNDRGFEGETFVDRREAFWPAISNQIDYVINQDYIYTVKYQAGKISLWIDDTCIISDWTMPSEITNVQPVFGLDYDGTAGTVSNVHVWGDVESDSSIPSIGTEYNVAGDCTNLPTSFSGDKYYLNFNDLQATTADPTWYYSGTFQYSEMGNYTGLTPVFAEGTYKGNRKELAIVVRNSGENALQLVVWAGHTETPLTIGAPSGSFETGKDYTFTVKYHASKVSYWIDQTYYGEFELKDDSGNEVTDITPKFGLIPDATKGTVSNLKIWGDVADTPAPVIGSNTNLAEGRIMPQTFKAGTTQYLDLGKLETSKTDASWCYSAEFTYDTVANAYVGLTPIFASGLYKGSKVDLSVVQRQNGQFVVWAGSAALMAPGTSANYTANQKYTFTVQYKEGKISYWMDKKYLGTCDLSASGITDIQPKFGLNPDGTNGTLSNFKVWGDLKSASAPTREDDIANLVSGNITGFDSTKPTQYFDNERILISNDNWHYAGELTYTELSDWLGAQLVFGEGTYASRTSDLKGSITGTRDISISVRNTSNGVTQCLIWADDCDVAAVPISCATLVKGKAYAWNIEVKKDNGKYYLTFWFDNILVCDEFDLSSYITNLVPKFGIRRYGTSGTVANVEIWDGSTKVETPVFTSADTDQAIFESISLTADSGRMFFDGMTYGDVWYYQATVKGAQRLVLGQADGATVEVYADGTNVVLVKRTESEETVLASKEAADQSKQNYKVRYDNGKISVWFNNQLVIENIAVTGMAAKAGVAGTEAGSVEEICLWGDVTATDAVIYQAFADIAPYRTGKKTSPALDGYVFAGWYEDADETTAVSEETTSGAAYAKLVPEAVLSVKAQVSAGTSYDSENSTTLRLITSVDSIRYQKVGFDVTFGSTKAHFDESTVFTKIVSQTDADKVTSDPSIFHKTASKYFCTTRITSVPADVYNQVFTVEPQWTTLDGTAVTGVARQIAVNDSQNARWTEQKLDNGLGGSKIYQLSTTTTTAQMMGYVIRAYDKATDSYQTIVVDGGMYANYEYLYWVLNTKCDGKVDAWFITHAHEDHYGALQRLLENNKIGDGEGQIEIGTLYYHFPANWNIDNENDTCAKLAKEFYASIDNCAYMTGKVSSQELYQTYTYGNLTMTVLSDPDTYWGVEGAYTNGDHNNASIITLAEFDNGTEENTKVLFTGDMGREGEAYVKKQMDASGVDYKGAVVQMAHHGNSGISRAFYDELQPAACIWPCTDWLWENYRQGTKETKIWENTELYQYLMSRGVDKHYIAAYGNYEFY